PRARRGAGGLVKISRPSAAKNPPRRQPGSYASRLDPGPFPLKAESITIIVIAVRGVKCVVVGKSRVPYSSGAAASAPPGEMEDSPPDATGFRHNCWRDKLFNSFPRSTWERRLGRSASVGSAPPAGR